MWENENQLKKVETWAGGFYRQVPVKIVYVEVHETLARDVMVSHQSISIRFKTGQTQHSQAQGPRTPPSTCFNNIPNVLALISCPRPRFYVFWALRHHRLKLEGGLKIFRKNLQATQSSKNIPMSLKPSINERNQLQTIKPAQLTKMVTLSWRVRFWKNYLLPSAVVEKIAKFEGTGCTFRGPDILSELVY